jgi:hypothetical protein
MNGLALQVQEALGRDPHAGDLYVFRAAAATWSVVSAGVVDVPARAGV